MTETAIYYSNGDTCAWMSTDERRWVNWARRMAESHPNEVIIKSEDRDGTVVVGIPISWIKVSPPRKCNLTDEQRQERAQMLQKHRVR